MHIEVVIRKKSGDSNSSESASVAVEKKKHKADHQHHAAAPELCEAFSSITDISEASFANGVNNNHNVRLTDISVSSFANGVNDTHSLVLDPATNSPDHHQKDPVTTPKNLSPQSSQRRQSMSDDENGDGNSNNNDNMDGTHHNGMLEHGGSGSELNKPTSENTDTDPSKIPTHDPTNNSNEPGNMGSLKSMMEVIKEDKALDPSRLNIRKQSEILSKIPPFNLFIRNFEELTTSKVF